MSTLKALLALLPFSALLLVPACNGIVTVSPVDGGPGSENQGDSGPDVSNDTDSGPSSDGGPGADSGPSTGSELVVDGISCTVSSVDTEQDQPPCGVNWTTTVSATCGSLGAVELDLNSTSGIPYPQTCRQETQSCSDTTTGSVGAGLTILSEADGGITYGAAVGACTISSGPTATAPSTAIASQGQVTGSGASHTYSFNGAAKAAALLIDGMACAMVTNVVMTKGPATGHTWSDEISASCPGGLGAVSLYVAAPDDAPYPQSTNIDVQLSVGGEGDAGFLAYDAQNSGSSASITSGPTVANESTPSALTATLTNGAGKSHTVSFTDVAH